MKQVICSIETGIKELQKGNFLIVVDDKNRENEGDLIIAAEMITTEKVNFMEQKARGLICTPMTKTRCQELQLPMMTYSNTSEHETPFTISIDYKKRGCTTGISAYDRAQTILALTKHDTMPEDFGRPGHVFPLRAKANGVLERAGHTEAVVDLMKLAKLKPIGVLIEIKNEDGSMSRMPDLIKFADKYDFKIISIADLITYRNKYKDSLITQLE